MTTAVFVGLDRREDDGGRLFQNWVSRRLGAGHGGVVDPVALVVAPGVTKKAAAQKIKEQKEAGQSFFRRGHGGLLSGEFLYLEI